MTRFACAALASLLLALPAAAQQGMFVTVQQTVPIAANATAAAAVACPANHVAWSGGADTDAPSAIDIGGSGPTFGATHVALIDVPTGSQAAPTGWRVTARNHSAIAHKLTVAAVCAFDFEGFETVVSVFSLPAGTPANPKRGGVSIFCTGSRLTLGGGVDTEFPATMIVTGSSAIVGNKTFGDLPAGAAAAPNAWSIFVLSEGAAAQVKVAVTCLDLGGLIAVSNARVPSDNGAAQNTATCPAGYTVLSGGAFPVDVVTQFMAIDTPVYAADPQRPVDRPDGVYPGPAGWTGNMRNVVAGSTAGISVGVVCIAKGNVLASSIFTSVYEFFNTNLEHYFRTASANEANAIDSGSAGPGWVRTGDDFVAYFAGGSLPGADVCRFYTFDANSHFYTVEMPECHLLQDPVSGWVYEGLSFRILKPAVGGPTALVLPCAPGTLKVHRLYNNRFAFNDSNHRFTTVEANVTALEAQGWKYEGIAFCAAAN